jgi:hypothetical protein
MQAMLRSASHSGDKSTVEQQLRVYVAMPVPLFGKDKHCLKVKE